MHAISGRSSLLRFAVVASFIPAKRQAKRIAAHKTETWASQLWHRARAMEQSADFVNGMLATWQAVPAGGSDLIFAGATTDSIVRTASCSGNSCNERFAVRTQVRQVPQRPHAATHLPSDKFEARTLKIRSGPNRSAGDGAHEPARNTPPGSWRRWRKRTLSGATAFELRSYPHLFHHSIHGNC